MKIEYQGKIVQVVTYDVTFPNGKVKRFEKAMRAPGVRLIIDHDGKILLNKERRTELQTHDLRLPGGKVFDTLEEYLLYCNKGDDIELPVLQAAILEGKEEVGISIDPQHTAIFAKKSCGATMERDLWYVVATNFSQLDEVHDADLSELDEGVFAGYDWHTYDGILNLIAKGEIQEARTAGVLAQYILSKNV